MSVSEKKKASNAKWDRENMFTLGCRIRKEQAAAFKDVCAAAGITANTALKDYVMECIDAQALIKLSGGGATPIPSGTETPSEAAQSGGDAATPDDVEAHKAAMWEHADGQTVPHDAIKWD